MKIFLNRKPVSGPWGGGNNFVKAFVHQAAMRGHQVTFTLNESVDVIFAIDPRYDELGISLNEMIRHRRTFQNSRLVYRVNECDARKGDVNIIDPQVKLLLEHADHAFFISSWLRDHHASKNARCRVGDTVIINGVSPDYLNTSKSESSLIRIVTHHWSNNKMKGHDIYEAIDDFVSKNRDYQFTYIGRSAGPLPHTRMISPVQGQELAKLLADNDVYISGSRFDPGPNHITEALACNLPTFAHRDGGGAVEMVGRTHVYETTDELLKRLLENNFAKNDFRPAQWSQCIDAYIDRIESLG